MAAGLFANEGAAVFLTARTEMELAATAGEINGATHSQEKAGFVTADLTRRDDGLQSFARCGGASGNLGASIF